jgi:Immunity protein Imm1
LCVKLVTELWRGSRVERSEREGPTWTEVEDAVAALDGERRTMAVLAGDDQSHVSVGGGPERYSVALTTADDRYLTLLDPGVDPHAPSVELVTGGQLGVFPGNTVVGRDQALRAVRAFFAAGEPAPDLPWREE